VAEEVALFIDLENITTALWNRFQQSPDPFKWVEKAREYGPIAFSRAYGDFSQPHLQRLEGDLRALGIDKLDCPTKQRGAQTQSTVDSNIIIDLYEVALDRPSIRTFILMAGDSDYIRVVARLRHRLDKDVVISAIPGSISRDLVRAAGKEDPLEPEAPAEIDEEKLIQLIEAYEASRRPGVLPTFRYLLSYVQDPRNSHVISPQVAHSKLNELVQRRVLVQDIVEGNAGTPVRVTRLNRDDELVKQALDRH
jgi:uncharacterized LabA/DUF88 family protein